MRRAATWLIIAVLAHAGVWARGVLKETSPSPSPTPSSSPPSPIAQLKAHCPHWIDKIASPSEIIGVWHLQELVMNFKSNLLHVPCIVSNFSTDGERLFADLNDKGDFSEDGTRNYAFDLADDGMWEDRVSVTPGGFVLGFSRNGLLVWCATSDALHRPVDVGSMLFARQPVAGVDAAVAALAPGGPPAIRWRTNCAAGADHDSPSDL